MTSAPPLAVPSLVSQVGNTRMVPIQRIAANANGNLLFGKLEGDNPAGSVKDLSLIHI